MPEKLYNLSTLRDIGGDDTAFIREMVDLFSTITPDTLMELEQAIQKQNWATAGSIAHSLKANLISYGIGGMIDVVIHLEKCATDETLRTDAPEQFQLLQHVCLQAIEQMKEDYL